METGAAQSIADRLKSRLGLKLVLLVVLNLWVYVPYLVLQRHRLFTATTMPASLCDRLVPFSAQTVWIYLSIYLLMPIGPFLMSKRSQIARYALGVILISCSADVVFLFWPSSCPRPDKHGTNAVYQSLVGFDYSLNAFPSLHAAFAVYSAMCSGMVMREMSRSRLWQIGFGFWAFLILFATLTTKQHIILDVAAGSALGFGVYCCVFHQRDFNLKRKSPLRPFALNSTQPNSHLL